ncbi:hypothetical protein OG21DRAFT_263571 [Imleria badia]|nr:hypothetical protein OG21DRAFT_263571 [Imleria badia]
MELFMKRSETHAASMPETALVEGEGNPPRAIPGGFTRAGLVNSVTGAIRAFAGWATPFLGRKLALSELQSTIASTSDGAARHRLSITALVRIFNEQPHPPVSHNQKDFSWAGARRAQK